ncbi:MAG: aldehyde ferredoxin oxidoreductase family protein [bacterium]|jgi:aldehyde:ferredoxin oxidoreductase
MKILRVNMTEQTCTWEHLPQKWRLLGNRGLAAKIVLKEVPPTCEPLGPYNKLIIAGGPLAGMGVSSAGRLSIAGKSPLTGGIKEANAGGTGATYMARHGIRAIVAEGMPADKEQLFLLYINKDGVKLISAPELKGLGNYALAAALLERYGARNSIISIGQAGELGMAAAGVFNTDAAGSPSRAAGRGGLGAVMGSKGLKAVVIAGDGTYEFPLAQPETFKELRQKLHKMIIDSPYSGQQMPKYGTAGLVPSISVMGAMPTRNFSSGSFEKAEDISGEALYQLITNRGGEGKATHACMPGCLVRCSNVVPDAEGKEIVSPVEYEALAMVGSNLGIGDLDAIAEINRRCNDYGLDIIEIGVAIGVAMDGGLLPFGDVEGTLRLLDEIAQGTVLGRVLGQGAVITGKVFNVYRIPAVKGQGMAGHEPRAVKGMSVTYAMSPMGADHTAGVTTKAPVEQTNPKGQMELSRNTQVDSAGTDTLGFCMFAPRCHESSHAVILKMLEAAYGVELDADFWQEVGKDTIKTERIFNERAGFTQADDRMPEFMLTEPLPPTNAVSDIPAEDYGRFWAEEFWGPLEEIW